MDLQYPAVPERQDVQLSPDMQAYIDNIVNQRVQNQTHQYHREREVREREVAAETAELRGQIDMLSDQLQVEIAESAARPSQLNPVPSTSRSTQSSRAAGKQPQAASKPLRRSPRKHGSTSTTKNTRGRPSTSILRRQASVEAAATSARRTQKEITTVKPATHVHRMLRSELPDDATGVQAALKLHLRLLWGLINAKDIPTSPSDSVLKAFEELFHDDAAVDQAHADGQPLVDLELVEVRQSVSIEDRSSIAAQLLAIEEHIIEYTKVQLAKFGLKAWCPDLRQTPYSVYNAAHRIIAIDTFKQALVAHAYAHLAPNISYAKNMLLLVQMYDHFVHHYQWIRYRRECRLPGSVRATDEANPAYKARARRAKARVKFLRENNYPKRYRKLCDPKATSDDEPDPAGSKVNGKPVHFINKRPERSVAAERFIRILDSEREAAAIQDSSRRWREHKRVVSPDQKISPFRALPEELPIDYFDPAFYNRLQPRLRHRVTNHTVALLPNIEESFRSTADEKLSDSRFHEKYYNSVIGRYNIPLEDELVSESDSDDNRSDDDMSVDDEDAMEEDGLAQGGPELTARQNRLATSLSAQTIG